MSKAKKVTSEQRQYRDTLACGQAWNHKLEGGWLAGIVQSAERALESGQITERQRRALTEILQLARGVDGGEHDGYFGYKIGRLVERARLAPVLERPTDPNAIIWRGHHIKASKNQRRLLKLLSRNNRVEVRRVMVKLWDEPYYGGGTPEKLRRLCANVNQVLDTHHMPYRLQAKHGHITICDA